MAFRVLLILWAAGMFGLLFWLGPLPAACIAVGAGPGMILGVAFFYAPEGESYLATGNTFKPGGDHPLVVKYRCEQCGEAIEKKEKL